MSNDALGTKRGNPESGCEDQEFEYFTVQWMTTPSGISYFGCFAKKDIPKHTLIHQEEPLLKSNDIWKALEGYESGEHATRQDDDDYLQHSVGLASEQQEQLWKLHDQRIFRMVFRTRINPENLACMVERPVDSIIPVVPTSVWTLAAGWTIRLFTSRNISRGEELCLSYNQVIYYHTREERRKVLQNKYRFDCQCAACCHEGEDDSKTKESDHRRLRLRSLAKTLAYRLPDAYFMWDEYFEQRVRDLMGIHDEIDHSTEDTSPTHSESSSFEMLQEYLELLHQEGMEHDLLQASELAFDLACWQQEQDHESSLPRWARQTMSLYRLHKGSDHLATKTFRAKLQSQGIRLKSIS
eukprot:CAMPEP_0176104808 /NCGR_PEP_ID=MMETSP0120_2-20121206/52592_1 /TAXON_ID=160619 /ORGANISM="Kryptoperidinium foliaceum, Strain CCMP 1326" /LENGTH=353 /DNA_ID=CAMNT_0017438917 /DNA_START=61 /DNA_END=1123 /DNA_ORIENTATION=+